MRESESELEDDFSWLVSPLLGWKAVLFWAIAAVAAVGLLVALTNLPIISGNVPA